MSIINQAKSAIIAAAKQEGATIVGPITGAVQNKISELNALVNKGVEFLKSPLRGIGGQGAGKVPPGAVSGKTNSTQISFKDAFGNQKFTDTRVKIRVPNWYLTSRTMGSDLELLFLGGIVFPYTPSVTYEMKADYQTITPTHSNFPINFYQRSALGNISIVGKFTVQNEKDAAIYISTINLLRILTKSHTSNDWTPGSPPPVCRLDAFGTDMLKNVPVAVQSFRIETPESVDYFTYGKTSKADDLTSVPVVSTLSVTLVPMYSRNEMMKFGVSKYLASNDLSKEGFL